ncbi:MAG TPA: aldo/keto reductase [Phycisphaerales bacterium]|nr:aldo/keto reductase [Phycisphaerales bacterium]
MWYKPYGKTGKKISVISFGGMRFADPKDLDASAAVVLHGYRQGINYFDTAPFYCGDRSEDIFGAAVKQMKPGTFYLSTKCGVPDGGELRKSLEQSLKRLHAEKIHFFHIWCVTSLAAWEKRKSGGAVAAALKAKEEGLIEHVVISSHLPGNELRGVLEEGWFEGVTLGYCAINFPYREEALALAGRMNLGVVTMNPLAGGVIPRNAERMGFIKGPRDESVVAAALRFNISHDDITSALVGFSNVEQVDEACRAVENFRPYEQAHLDAVRRNVKESFNDLCTGCGYCLPCPQGVAVPKMMDSYNMKILMGQDPVQIRNRLKWHWNLKPSDAKACSLCGACEERCTQHLPIRERMKEIIDLPDET